MNYDNSSQRLRYVGLPEILDLSDFSFLTHISKRTLFDLSINSGKYYKTYTIPKRSGGLRLIAQPSKKLKGIQAWVLVNILNKLKVSESCKGFEIGSSIADNASAHVGANIVINLDLADFFESVQKKKVFGIFRSVGYNSRVSTVLTNLCTFGDGLPQGGPCSPKLANLAAWRLDARIQGFVGKRGITYTRYADDLTFSGLHPNKVAKIIPTIRKIVESEDFSVNKRKTRVSGPSRAKTVTGLVTNEKTFGIGKKKYKKLRAKIYHFSLVKNGENNKLFQHLAGWLAYLKSVDPVRHQRALEYMAKLSKGTLDSPVEQLLLTHIRQKNAK